LFATRKSDRKAAAVPLARERFFVLNILALNFGFVSDFVLRISDFETSAHGAQKLRQKDSNVLTHRTDSMADIRQLPPSVINKIAAGEVIERPASLVKELMENSVDAGATRIDVSIEKGGTELVRMADDGCGISPDQLKLAVASHATSKIRDADELFDVRSLGFRGEALASIAEVSRLLLRSRTGQDQAGAELEVVGGQLGDVAPCGSPVGTIVEVRQLFYNTPVRRKFLRTTQTELGHVSEAFTRIALAYHHVHFTLRHNDRVVHDLAPVESWRERITTLFGTEMGDGLIPVQGDGGNARLNGYVAHPSFSRANNRMQYLFLNGRYIRDRSLQHALAEAYRGLLLTGRYPIAFLRLEIPADAVDVNVHPTKLEVRFQDGGRIYSLLLGSLRQKFLSTDLTAKVQPGSLAVDSDPGVAHDRRGAEQHREELVSWAKGQLAGGGPQDSEAGGQRSEARGQRPGSGDRQSGLDLKYVGPGGDVPDFKPFPDSGGQASRLAALDETGCSDPPHRHAAGAAESQAGATEGAAGPAISHGGMQVHNRYLITENDSGVVVIDQHALHERILYEQLREKVLAGTLEKQRLLVPEPVSLTPPEAAAALEAQETLAQLGIEIESFGGDTVLVSSYPAMLANFNPSEILRQLVDQLLSGGKPPLRHDLLEDMLHTLSCKAAIKAGDRLTPEEISALLEQRHLFQDTHHCPHGRPTSLVFTREELDKRFKRT